MSRKSSRAEDDANQVMHPTIGLLLAGGQASRMGGGDKALIKIGGATILERVLDRLHPQCARIVLNANGDPARFAAFELPVFADDVPGFAGPLAGVLAGLDFIAERHPNVSYAVSVATDTPFLPNDLVGRLERAREAAGATLASARSGGSSHPVIALWPVALRHDLRAALLVENIRKVDRFLSRYPLAYADWDCEPYDPFFNVNTPEDLAEAERIWAERIAAPSGDATRRS